MKRTIALAAAGITLIGSGLIGTNKAKADEPADCYGDDCFSEEVTEMDLATAGSVYLEWACPAFSALARYEAVAKPTGHKVSAKARLAARRASHRFIDMAMELGDGTSSWGDWPEAIDEALTTMADAATEDSDETLDDIDTRGYRWTGDEELMFPETGEEQDAAEAYLGVHC